MLQNCLHIFFQSHNSLILLISLISFIIATVILSCVWPLLSPGDGEDGDDEAGGSRGQSGSHYDTLPVFAFSICMRFNGVTSYVFIPGRVAVFTVILSSSSSSVSSISDSERLTLNLLLRRPRHWPEPCSMCPLCVGAGVWCQRRR